MRNPPEKGKPTPGEWVYGVVQALGDTYYGCLVKGTDTIIALTGLFGTYDSDESKANAQLISAAPDMVAALQTSARVLAEIADKLSGDDLLRLNAVRTLTIAAVKKATPLYYGGE